MSANPYAMLAAMLVAAAVVTGHAAAQDVPPWDGARITLTGENYSPAASR